jgi:phage gpG-like protein
MSKLVRHELGKLSNDIKELEKFFKNLPIQVGNIALNFYLDSFKRQGFIDTSFERWKARSKADKNQKRRGNRAILTKSGALKRSIKMAVRGFSIIIYSDVPYAQIHNEGGTITGTANVKAHKRRMRVGRKSKVVDVKAHPRKVNIKIPKRQFMGESSLLEKRIIKNIELAISKILPK